MQVQKINNLLYWDDLSVTARFQTSSGIQPLSLDFCIYDITGRDGETRLYSNQRLPEIPFDSPDVRGFIKFDGCSHLYLNDGYIHLCGVDEWKRFIAILERIREFVNANYTPLIGNWGK